MYNIFSIPVIANEIFFCKKNPIQKHVQSIMIKKHKKEPYPMNKTAMIPYVLRIKPF